MSVKPNERIEFFLAKIAGEDIDTNTLTPPGAINATERALDGISERLNGIESASSDNDRFPDPPATDGVYTPRASVTNGVPSYGWAQGGSGGGLLIKVLSTEESESLDKTWNQIYSAILSGSAVTIIDMEGDTEDPDNITIRFRQIKYVGSDVSHGYGYAVGTDDGEGHVDAFTCSSPDDYPESMK